MTKLKWGMCLLLPACLSVPDGPQPECESNTDCDTAHGEVCEEGVCWGNPPPGSFAAIVTPPSERKSDLVSRELELASIPPDGYLGDVALEQPVLYTGQIIAVCPAPVAQCDTTPLGATIVVTRPSFFAGGPGYRQVVTTDPRNGSFAIALPPTRPDDPAYTVTVVPDGRDPAPGTIDTGELVPPMQARLRVAEDQNGKSFQLGATALPTIEGKIINGAGVGQANYRVVAMGRWDALQPATEVSTVFYTGDDGTYSLRLSEELLPGSTLEIVAKSYGSELAPTLHMNVTEAGITAITGKTMMVPNVGRTQTVKLKVKGTATGGEVTGVVGARVTVKGVVAPPQPGGTLTTYSAEGTTGENGDVDVKLFDGAVMTQSYRVSVVPPVGSPLGMVFDVALDLANTQLANTELKLPERVALTGKVLGVDGKPLKDVQVTVRPSLRFQWSLEDTAQAFITAIPAATALTPDTGEFVLFVDPFLDKGLEDVWGYYDISFEPTATTNAPSWTEFDVEIPRDTNQPSISLPDLTLPDAAHIHGRVTDASGASIEGAELKLFSFSAGVSPDLCMQVPHAPTTCPIPARQLGRGTSDDAGTVRLTLPRL